MKKCRSTFHFLLFLFLFSIFIPAAQTEPVRKRTEPQPVKSSWDDLLEGIQTPEQWKVHKEVLRKRYLELIRDDQKPARPPLGLVVHETVNIDGVYERRLISYNVEADERAHAFLAIPLGLKAPAPAVVSLHGTYAHGKEREAGLEDNPEKAFLDQLARRGYVVIAPDHFVAGERIPPEGAYDTARFYQKHPQWTAVGKSAFESSIAVDVLRSLKEVDPERIGTLGHSLGGHGAYFLAAYDPRIKVAVSNSGCAPFRYNSKVEAWARGSFYVYLKPMRERLLKGFLPPIDMHEIMALIAPRPFLDLSGLNDLIAGDNPRLAGWTYRQRVLMLMKVMDVYELEKAAANFAFYSHGQGHSVPYEARQLIYGWLDKHLKGPEATRARLVTNDRFSDLGVAAPASESRGVVAVRDRKGRELLLSLLLDSGFLGSILVTDIDSGETTQVYFPESTGSDRWPVWAPYASLLSRNGRFYTFAGKTMLEFDIDRREFTFHGVPAPTEECYTGSAMIDGPDGRIYAGSYPNSHLVSFDPATRELKDHGPMDTAEHYPDCMAVDSTGWLYCGIGTARFNIIAFHPRTGVMRRIVKESERALGTARVFSGTDGCAYGQAGEIWYRMSNGKGTKIAKETIAPFKPSSAISFGMKPAAFPDGRKLEAYSLPDKRFTIEDPRNNSRKEMDIRFQSGGAAITSLVLGPDGKIYGSSSHPMHFFAYDLVRRELNDLGAIRAIGGGNICAMAVQGKYVAGPSYSRGFFHLFDTTRPFNPESQEDPNPKIIAQFEQDIARPRTCLAHPDGEHVLMAGFMGYGRTGGGIGIVSLKTGETTLLTHEQVIPLHSTHTLKALPSGDLVGGTSVLTPGGGHTTEKEGVLYLMDWKTRKVVYRTVPVPGAAEVFSLEIGSNGLVYGIASGSRFFVFDPVNRAVVKREDLSAFGGLVRPSLILGPDKKIYGVLGKSIFRVEPGTMKIEKLADSPVPITAGLAISDGRIYFASGPLLWSFRL